MGKKDKKKAAQEQQGSIPWKDIDKDPVGFLVAPETAEAFFRDCWERQPRVFKATPGRAALARALTSLPRLLAWLKDEEAAGGGSPLLFGRDVNAARYRDGVRETPNGPGKADADALRALHDKEGCTLQVHQPQRWDDAAWRLQAALEAKLGALVGANAYLTPAGAQGLAPHHDDVELWVLQTAGSKDWRCYAPVAGHELPSACSGDLQESSLGAPVLEATLEVGDVLYMPRGTVHQARAAGGAPSAHLTISAHQGASYGDLALHLIATSLKAQHDEPDRCLPPEARRGPPPGLAFDHSLHRVLAAPAGAGPTPGVIAGLAAALRAVADKLAASPDMLTPAVHAFSADFWAHRLPPHPAQMPQQGPAPELEDRIWCRAAPWCCLMPYNGPGHGGCGGGGSEGGDEGEGEEGGGGGGGEGAVKLVTCLHNVRESHMVGGGSESESDDGDDDDDESGSGSEDDGGSGDGSDGDGDGGAVRAAQAKLLKKAAAAAAAAAAAGEANEGGGGEGGHDCCAHDGACGHDHGHGHEGGSGSESGDEEGIPPGARGPDSLPGMVFPGGDTLKALVAFMAADSPAKAVPISSLPLQHDADKLHLAFALWAEGFAAVSRGNGGGGGGKGKGREGGGEQGGPAAKKAKK